jgi:hypothetical protein
MAVHADEQFPNLLSLPRVLVHEEARVQKHFAGSIKIKQTFTLVPHRRAFNQLSYESEQVLIHWWIGWGFLRLKHKRGNVSSIESQFLCRIQRKLRRRLNMFLSGQSDRGLDQSHRAILVFSAALA